MLDTYSVLIFLVSLSRRLEVEFYADAATSTAA